MKCPRCKFEFKDAGRVKGGKKSRRKLTKKEARRIANIRHGNDRELFDKSKHKTKSK